MEGPQVKHRPPGEDYWQNIDRMEHSYVELLYAHND